MGRMTDHDKNFGPITVGWCHKGMTLKSIAIENFGEDDDYYGTCLTMYCNRLVVRVRLPHFLKPYREWREANWDAETVKRMGCTGYWNCDPREFSIGVMDGHVSIRYGRQTGDSSTDKMVGFFLPWTQWRMVRHSLYDAAGELFFEQLGTKRSWDEHYAAQLTCPTRTFTFRDYDDATITATTHIEEREWLRGEKWCSWLSWFMRTKVARSLDISFSDEVGPAKGSWKGGTVGHGIDMLADETHDAAFLRYCEQGYHRHGRTYPLTYIGEVTP